MIAHNNKILEECLTYEDVLLIADFSDILPREVIFEKITRDITFNFSFALAAMHFFTASIFV